MKTQMSFRGDAKHRTRKFDLPGSLVSLAPRNDVRRRRQAARRGTRLYLDLRFREDER
jgi:hypothetical protein